jgi:hypothetical protein
MDEGKTDQNNGKSFGVQSNHGYRDKSKFYEAIFTVVAELRKEVRQYERNTENLVNTTRILSERRKL